MSEREAGSGGFQQDERAGLPRPALLTLPLPPALLLPLHLGREARGENPVLFSFLFMLHKDIEDRKG